MKSGVAPKHSRLRSALRDVLILCLAICVTRLVAGSTDSASPSLRVFDHDGNFVQYRVYPEGRASMLFPTSEAWAEEQLDTDNWSIHGAPILKKLRLLRISDMAHRFTVTGAAAGDQLFLFDGLFCSENSQAMSELIRATHSAPGDGTQALNLVKLYLALSYYQLADPDSFVGVRSGKPGLKSEAETPRTFSDLVGIAHSPHVLRRAGGYSVDLYTRRDPDVTPRAIHWKMKLAPAGFDEQMASYGSTERTASEGSAEKNTGNKRIMFQVEVAGEGVADDGARTDIQSWSASDGPGISRVHYYYPSPDKAEKRMAAYLQNALAVLEDVPWKNGKGGSGREAIVILINKDKGSLYASHLYLDDAGVLELSCPCLRNIWLGRSINDARNQN